VQVFDYYHRFKKIHPDIVGGGVKKFQFEILPRLVAMATEVASRKRAKKRAHNTRSGPFQQLVEPTQNINNAVTL